MKLLLAAVAVAVGGLAAVIRRSKSGEESKAKKLRTADDTPVVIGDSASAFIKSDRKNLSEYILSDDGRALTNLDDTRKCTQVIVTERGETQTYGCEGGGCEAWLRFKSGLELTVSAESGSGLVIGSSDKFEGYDKPSNTRWVRKNAGSVVEGSVQIDDGEVVEIGPGPKCKVKISYTK